jgi:hypothetical protein
MKNKHIKHLRTYFIVFFICAFLFAFVTKAQDMIASAPDMSNAQDKHVPPTQPSNVPYETSFTGEYVCLPHKDTSGPQTLECALGLKLDDNTYIATDISSLFNSNQNPNFKTGSRLQVKGTFVPIEQISTDHWQKYGIKGILQVKEVLKI